MKKITNKYNVYLLLTAMLAYTACQPKEDKKETKSNTEIINEVNTVVAVGKVVPTEGWTLINASQTGIIEDLYVKEGDLVEANQALFKLSDPEQVTLEQDAAQIRLASVQAQRQTNNKEIERERIKLQDLQQKWDVSKKLYAKNAETLEKVNADQSAVLQQQKVLETLLSKEKIDKLSEREQEINLQKAAKNKADLHIRAPRAGIVNELTAEIGQAVTTATQLGKIVNNTDVRIEAEVDELFADKISVGQQVEFRAVGRTDLLGSGTIVYTSPSLMNKSILYESVGESEDRRVRRVRIQPNEQHKLLINAKVECQIKLK